MRVQFVLKKNEIYSFVSYCRRSSGLWNSTRFIAEALAARGIHTDVVEVDDNNGIDAEVARFKPDICIVEALWVVPEKFDVLKSLHRNVSWYVHMHSGLPFLALEGIAMQWLAGYAARGVGVIANSKETDDAFKAILPADLVTFLPNIYLPAFRPPVRRNRKHNIINVGCFGALRPMKNHMMQAVAAIAYANKHGKQLHFHINASRIETGGEPVLNNLRALFATHHPHRLVECPWMEPTDFINYLHDQIDVGLQVSMTETFNIVTADYVTAGLPIVVSSEVPWTSSGSQVSEHSVPAIVAKMEHALRFRWRRRMLIAGNQSLLLRASQHASERWSHWVHSHEC